MLRFINLNIVVPTVLTVVFSLANATAQTCDCKTDVAFLAERYQEDYGGFKDFKVENPDWGEKFQAIITQSEKTDDIIKCHEIIGELIDYLNNGHVYFGAWEDNPKFEELYKSDDDDKNYYPSLDFPNPETALLAIRTGNLEYKIDLDTLIENNQSYLDAVEHLIIDLRGNSGGGDDTYTKVIPYIYTNPIISYTAEFWASENNIKGFEKFSNDPNLPEETKEWLNVIIEKAKKNPNSFVQIGENLTDTLSLDQVKEFPKRVSILIDGECTSATEEFLLKAKQSSKTTIYGYEPSGGVLDYANLNPVFTPSGYWYATIPTSRSKRLPENPVDPDGIAPDVLVDKSVEDIVAWVLENG